MIQDLELAAQLGLHLVLYQSSHLKRLSYLAVEQPESIQGLKLHLKIEDMIMLMVFHLHTRGPAYRFPNFLVGGGVVLSLATKKGFLKAHG